MDEQRILKLACVRLGYPVEQVLAYRVYEDQIVLVVEAGHKYRVPLAELEKMEADATAQEKAPEPESAPEVGEEAAEPESVPEAAQQPMVSSLPKPKRKRRKS